MIETILIEGLIYSIMVLGLFISYRTLNFCDMTVDGAFPMGGCILAACLTQGNHFCFYRWMPCRACDFIFIHKTPCP